MHHPSTLRCIYHRCGWSVAFDLPTPTSIEPECADPGNFIRRVLEERASNPPFRLAASSRGAMLVVFLDAFVRATVMQFASIHLNGHELILEHMRRPTIVFSVITAPMLRYLSLTSPLSIGLMSISGLLSVGWATCAVLTLLA